MKQPRKMVVPSKGDGGEVPRDGETWYCRKARELSSSSLAPQASTVGRPVLAPPDGSQDREAVKRSSPGTKAVLGASVKQVPELDAGAKLVKCVTDALTNPPPAVIDGKAGFC